MTSIEREPRERWLLLMRHAHAQNHDNDHERQLSEHGRTAAWSAGLSLRTAGLIPERILSSSAERARQTAELVARACGYSGAIQIERALYLATSDQLRTLLAQVRPSVMSVLVVSHNPGASAFARELGVSGCDLAPADYVLVHLALTNWTAL